MGLSVCVRGVLFVGALLTISVIKVGTDAGVTFSTIVKAGSRMMDVESGVSGSSGTGILDAESMSR